MCVRATGMGIDKGQSPLSPARQGAAKPCFNEKKITSKRVPLAAALF